MNVVIIVIWN